jgi:indolepyruvate ferredoxin oxidoreductase alpha subunit
MGDGGFWHNGLPPASNRRFQRNDDGVLVIMKNGYTSATGTQEHSTPRPRLSAREGSQSLVDRNRVDTLKGSA